MNYVGVIVDISHEQLDKTFTYAVPEALRDSLEIGNRVIIPFGRTTRTGYVVEEIEKPAYDPAKIRDILAIDSSAVTVDGKLIRLAYWLKRNYGGTIQAALKTVIPVKEKVRQENQQSVSLLIDPREALAMAEECKKKHRVAQARLLEALAWKPVADFSLLNQKLNISRATVEALERQGIVESESITVFRNSLHVKERQLEPIRLNPEQQAVADGILAEIHRGDETPCLIRGVTGSGKTEVYMELIEATIREGKEAIVLIPEISLTYQNVMRFYERFGDRVSIIHSRLSKGEKYDRFEMAKRGELKCMIGPRSALFTPFQNLGLIIIDEEHENAYQSEGIPQYHARETAIALAAMDHGKVVLGSATPSLEAQYRAEKGEYHLYTLSKRAGSASLPTVHIVDLREELHQGNRSVFSGKLRELIEDRLEKKEQIMLFLNRRGYQGFINCRDCGKTIECPHCAVSLTEHRGGKLVCHYCGYEEAFRKICPSCGGKHIGTFKAGTEKIEEEAAKLFPQARILRMDRDTTKGKDGHEKILEQFASQEADILIGTQMIVKGHDFPKVTLMGILLADTSLHAPDYTAAERTFELLTQAAGRAGRAELPGEVVFQTYDPEHYAIRHAAAQDYESFYEEEIFFRRMMDYPPVKHMMAVRISSADEEKAIRSADRLRALEVPEKLRVIGPANATIYKINDVYTRVIYYKAEDRDLLVAVKDSMEDFVHTEEESFKKVSLQFDFR